MVVLSSVNSQIRPVSVRIRRCLCYEPDIIEVYGSLIRRKVVEYSKQHDLGTVDAEIAQRNMGKTPAVRFDLDVVLEQHDRALDLLAGRPYA